MPLRLAFVSLHTSPADAPGSGDAGGMNVVESHQAQALARLGHHVEVLTRRSDPDTPQVTELSSGVVLRQVDAGPPTRLAKSLIDAHLDEFSAAMADLGPFDLIHSHHWMSGVAALPYARAHGIPHVQSYHSVAALPDSPLAQGEPPESPARVPGERLVARESDAVVAVSAAEAHTVVQRCGAAPERVSIVSPGVDRDRFRPLGPGEERWGAGELGPLPRGYILYAARLQPLKGTDLAIAAMAHVPAQLRPRLVVAGEVSQDFRWYREEIDALVADLGLTGDVTFVGPQGREELARMLRGSRIVLVPSHSETFGLIALEAAASGTPVVASAAGGLREAVAHGETGQLMDSRRPQDWGDAITRLLSDPELLYWQGQVARIHARRFDWDWAARRLEALYAELIASGPVPR